MSFQHIQNYYTEVERHKKFGGRTTEGTIAPYFSKLLQNYCMGLNLQLLEKDRMMTSKGKPIIPDGTIKNSMRIAVGYWESKDEKDVLEKEIDTKFSNGYPRNNILFEDSKRAILYQNGIKVAEAVFKNTNDFDALLQKFLTFQHEEAKDFVKAVVQFGLELPQILEALREMIHKEEKVNKKFIAERKRFLDVCQTSINDKITVADVNEMLIQHILTEELFLAIFSETQFHKENTIARTLYEVEATFFFGAKKRDMLNSIRHFYEVIKREATKIVDHHEKQYFLKVMYETFYKAYNPKAADRLGIVYTPLEIVRFQIEAVDSLLNTYFKKSLFDKNVEILDPATGTGTYICDLIDYLPPQYLEEKYRTEIHANEVELLPYYIANLNIEYTYRQKMNKYVEFENICFVDTLDNLQGLKLNLSKHGRTGNLFSVSHKNTERIERQNQRKISVIMGNPPYNANQQNENDNNKNREYPFVDTRIKDTFIQLSTAQKTKVYDMYARFYRWAMDRIEDNGIIAFITNRSFIDSRTFDGFRAYIEDNYDACYIVDTHSDVRANPKISGTGHNVFGIQTGVALMFLIRKNKKTTPHTEGVRCHIHYIELDDFMRRADKTAWFKNNPFDKLPFRSIQPDKNHNWLNITDNDFDDFLPIINKNEPQKAIFTFSSLGVSTNRDEWVFDFNAKNLTEKVAFFIQNYNALLKKGDNSFPTLIKWSEALKSFFKKNTKLIFNSKRIISLLYRPFTKQLFYSDKELSDRLTSNHYQIFGNDLQQRNQVIMFSGSAASKDFQCLAVNTLFGLDTLEKTNAVPLKTYIGEGKTIDNITDWALSEFQTHYGDKRITKSAIFAYVYAVLHCPHYRTKYAQNLKREFPRIPFYAHFKQWVQWGEALLALHLDYETVKPYPLSIGETDTKKTPKPKLVLGISRIILDENTTLVDFPEDALHYKLGNRSAIGWVLDQYKESKPSDPTILTQFNNYRFADHKNKVIGLLQRVTTVSIETVKIVREMEKEQH